mgnify:CR=1 FL=1
MALKIKDQFDKQQFAHDQYRTDKNRKVQSRVIVIDTFTGKKINEIDQFHITKTLQDGTTVDKQV